MSAGRRALPLDQVAACGCAKGTACGCAAPPGRTAACGDGGGTCDGGGRRARTTERAVEFPQCAGVTPDDTAWSRPPELGRPRGRDSSHEPLVEAEPRGGWLLLSDPIGTIPNDHRAPRVIYERMRDHLNATRPAGPRERAKRKPAGLAALLERVEARRAEAEAYAAPQGPPGAPGHAGGGPRRAPSTGKQQVTYEYGEVSFSVPADLVDRLILAAASEPAAITEVLWADVEQLIALGGASPDDLDATIGCLPMPTDGADFVFWRDDKGAPYTALMYALQMLVVCNEHIEDRESQDRCGWGHEHGDFIKAILTGREATRSTEHGTSNVADESLPAGSFKFHFLVPDARFYGPSDSIAGQSCYWWWNSSTAPVPWNELGYYLNPTAPAPPFDHGIVYDEWEAKEYRSSRGLRFVVGEHPVFGEATGRGGAPDANCAGGGHATGDFDRVIFHPSWLWFEGVLDDELMLWAGVALEYYYITRDRSYYDAAYKLGRHVLRHILRWCVHAIHEIGHVFCGGSHCDTNGCFMDHAGLRFECAVRARLGLYHSMRELEAGTDACFLEDDRTCSSIGDTSWCNPLFNPALGSGAGCRSYQNDVCRIGDGLTFTLGESTSEYFFCMTPCTPGSQAGDSYVAVSDCSSFLVSYISDTAPDHSPRAQQWRVCGQRGTIDPGDRDGELHDLPDTWPSDGIGPPARIIDPSDPFGGRGPPTKP